MLLTEDTFGPYSPEHGLCVVDMQRDFLDKNDPELLRYIRKLTENICRHVYDCLSQKGEVVIIEFEGFGETSPSIIESAESGYRAGHTGRRMSDQGYRFFTRRNNDDLVVANQYFQSISRTRKWTTSGVSTPACVSSHAHGLRNLGLDVRVRAGLTLNPNSVEKNELTEFDNGLIKEGLLYVPPCKIHNAKSLVQYLYTR